MDDLEQAIADLIARKNAALKARRNARMAARQLRGLHYSCEGAGPIMEDLDPLEWSFHGA
jgi:hypothetical protein